MNLYLAFKWLHVVAIISWLAGLLYLFRLFVYHAEWGAKSSDNHEMLVVMEHKLLYYITHPAMGMAWLAGLFMLSQNPLLLKQGWMHTKILFVVLLTAQTVVSGRLHKRFKNKASKNFSGKQFRFLNEGTTLLMVLIVGLVVLRPF